MATSNRLYREAAEELRKYASAEEVEQALETGKSIKWMKRRVNKLKAQKLKQPASGRAIA